MFKEHGQDKQLICDHHAPSMTTTAVDAEPGKKDARAIAAAQPAAKPSCEPLAETRRNANGSAGAVNKQFTENLWLDALRRHNDSRQHWRQLLDRYLGPHQAN